MAHIDHLVWAAPDLERAIDELQARTGRRALVGGAHPGAGTRNAVLGLGRRAYLEILAPDPAQAAVATPAAELSKLAGPVLHTFAVATDRLDRVAVKLERAGLPHAGVIPMSRRLPTGDAGDDCRLTQLSLSHPEAWSLRPLLEKLDVEVDVQAGETAITAQLETPAGRVRLSSLDHVHG